MEYEKNMESINLQCFQERIDNLREKTKSENRSFNELSAIWAQSFFDEYCFHLPDISLEASYIRFLWTKGAAQISIVFRCDLGKMTCSLVRYSGDLIILQGGDEVIIHRIVEAGLLSLICSE